MRRIIIIFSLLALNFFPFALLTAQENKTLEGIEFLTGFAWGKLKEKGNYYLFPLKIFFDFNLKNLTQKIGFHPRPLLQFQVEPFINFVSQPKQNLETGISFWFKMGILPETSRFQPYFKLGTGIVYLTQHTREQATQFNFTEQAFLGMHYYFNKNTAFTLEGGIRHLSNASLKSPNHGINSYAVLTGITYNF